MLNHRRNLILIVLLRDQFIELRTQIHNLPSQFPHFVQRCLAPVFLLGLILIDLPNFVPNSVKYVLSFIQQGFVEV